MALITCPDCGGAVSDAAPACIHCGRPMASAPPASPYAAPSPAVHPYAAPSYAARPPVGADSRAAKKAARAASSKTIALIGYGLQLLAFAYFIPGIAALVLAYLRRGDARGTWVESHFDWQIETFWNGVGLAVGAILLTSGTMWITESREVGMLLLYATAAGIVLWYIYRIVRGGLALNDEQAIG